MQTTKYLLLFVFRTIVPLMDGHNRAFCAAKLRQKILETGYTRKHVARKSDLSTDYIGYLIRGERRPSVRAIRLLALALNCSPDDLCDFENMAS